MSRFLLLAAFWFCMPLAGDADDKPSAAKPKTSETAEDQIIREKTKAFMEAFNRGDAAALAAHYAKDGEIVDTTGKTTRGREAIQKQLESFFSKNKGAKLEQNCEAVRLVTPEVIIERGCMTLTSTAGPPARNRYTAVLVKRDGQWLIENLRTTDDTATAEASGPLAELDFIIGEWVEADDTSVVHTIAEWTPGRKYIFRTFSIYVKDDINTQGTEIIAWDPAAKTIRSWIFESDGDFGERTWTKQDGRWVIKCTGTLADGKKMSCVNTVRPIDANRMAWQSTARDIGGKLHPNTPEIIVVRKQPRP
jgi:uncharacterized protein (TIGR02246 family)